MCWTRSVYLLGSMVFVFNLPHTNRMHLAYRSCLFSFDGNGSHASAIDIRKNNGKRGRRRKAARGMEENEYLDTFYLNLPKQTHKSINGLGSTTRTPTIKYLLPYSWRVVRESINRGSEPNEHKHR